MFNTDTIDVRFLSGNFAQVCILHLEGCYFSKHPGVQLWLCSPAGARGDVDKRYMKTNVDLAHLYVFTANRGNPLDVLKAGESLVASSSALSSKMLSVDSA